MESKMSKDQTSFNIPPYPSLHAAAAIGSFYSETSLCLI